MTRCKVGDTAVIEWSVVPSLVGRFVEVLEPFVPDDKYAWWHCRLIGGPALCCIASDPGARQWDNFLACPDIYLRPIRPNTEPQSIDKPEEVAA